jgi:hypothetical protein
MATRAGSADRARDSVTGSTMVERQAAAFCFIGHDVDVWWDGRTHVRALHIRRRANARGQGPGPAVGELDHTVWTTRDGAPSGVTALAQSADGVLWIGAASTAGQLALDRLRAGGASVLTHGRVVSYGQRDGLPEGAVTAFAHDSARDTWLATSRGLLDCRAPVATNRSGEWISGWHDARPFRRPAGTLWAHTSTGIFVLPRGATRFVRQGSPLDRASTGGGMLREAPDGSVWGATNSSRALGTVGSV